MRLTPRTMLLRHGPSAIPIFLDYLKDVINIPQDAYDDPDKGITLVLDTIRSGKHNTGTHIQVNPELRVTFDECGCYVYKTQQLSNASNMWALMAALETNRFYKKDMTSFRIRVYLPVEGCEPESVVFTVDESCVMLTNPFGDSPGSIIDDHRLRISYLFSDNMYYRAESTRHEIRAIIEEFPDVFAYIGDEGMKLQLTLGDIQK